MTCRVTEGLQRSLVRLARSSGTLRFVIVAIGLGISGAATAADVTVTLTTSGPQPARLSVALGDTVRARHGAPTILVNAAGMFGPIALIKDVDALEWVRTVEVDAIAPFLTELEQRLTWQPRPDQPPIERLRHLGEALLAIKEVEYLGSAEQGDLHDRRRNLIERILRPIEDEWIGKPADEHVISRVKDIRTAVLPALLRTDLPAAERERIRRQLADVYLAQQLHFHPEDYVSADAPPEHLLEAVERLEEDLTDAVRVHGRFRVLLDIGEAIEIPSGREKRTDRNEPDTLLEQLSESLRSMLEASGREVAASRGQTVNHALVEQPEHVAAGS